MKEKDVPVSQYANEAVASHSSTAETATPAQRETRRPNQWRSLDELADTPEFRSYLDAEFPREAALLDDIGRRQFLKLMGASLALGGVSGCTRQPVETVVPYVRAPEEIIPGKPLYYATATLLGGFARGVLVESHMGRPTKIEGNPEHPASGGASDSYMQAWVLGFYDPDRSQVVRHIGEIRPWNAFVDAMRLALDGQRERQGAGLRILTETVTSPTLAHQLRSLLHELPQARWHQYEPLNRDNPRAGSILAFGEVVDTQYHLDKAAVILSLDADFLAEGPAALAQARDFGRRRRADHADGMSRLYVVESSPTITGAKADHRLPLRSGDVESLARALLAAVEARQAEVPSSLPQAKWLQALARDLRAHRGSSLVVVGDSQPPQVHALAHAINAALGNVGKTITYCESIVAEPVAQMQSLRDLAADITAGRVDVLLILGGNPVYNAPADLGFADLLRKVPLRAHLSAFDDETSELCQWHVAEAHPLEAWSDARAFDGTTTILQPLILPLYEGKTAHEVLAVFSDRPLQSSHDIVREYWKSRGRGSGAGDWRDDAEFEHFWRKALHDGLVPGTAAPVKQVSLRAWSTPPRDGDAPDSNTLEIVFQRDAATYDGRFANNGWLQELPRPLTKLTWDNAALVSPATAKRLGLQNGDVTELRFQERRVGAPVWIVPGQADGSVAVQLGYGRRRAGRVGDQCGFDAYALRTTTASSFGPGLTIRKTGAQHLLASTQDHQSMEGRELVRVADLAEYRAQPNFAQLVEPEPPRAMTMYKEHVYDGYAWGMSIDLNACIGCGACSIACQAENNIPVVGKDQVSRGREMHWIRIDRYFEGDPEDPRIYHQPVPCMHCENAPCEVVCPVNATVHSSEGLNEMVYNRCVGTKYCSNNCPHKVRHFNFYLYTNQTLEPLKMQANPDVTVRSRGVMEKCTYCVQRINAARIDAKKDERAILDGEVVTACQQACPTQAIAFGDINDPQSQVAKAKADARNYHLLAELNTRPRTSYLAAVRNPNEHVARKKAEGV